VTISNNVVDDKVEDTNTVGDLILSPLLTLVTNSNNHTLSFIHTRDWTY